MDLSIASPANFVTRCILDIIVLDVKPNCMKAAISFLTLGKIQMRIYNIILTSISLLLSLGCATTEQYQTRIDKPVAINIPVDLIPPPGMAKIIVLRQYAFLGSGISIRVADSGSLIGKIGPGNFLNWDRPAGQVVIGASASNEANVSLLAENGAVYFLDTRTNWGAGYNTAACEIRLLNYSDGLDLYRKMQ
jgi:hypothetical protein